VGQPRAVHEQQRLFLGEEGLEPLPESLEEAPKLLLPYPLGEAVQGLEGGAGPVREELPVKLHGVAVSGLKIGPEEEEGQVEVPAVDPGVAPPALWPPPPVMGLGQLETDQKRLPQPAATFRHGIPSLSPALLQDKPRPPGLVLQITTCSGRVQG
jgi:hypothetical protein